MSDILESEGDIPKGNQIIDEKILPYLRQTDERAKFITIDEIRKKVDVHENSLGAIRVILDYYADSIMSLYKPGPNLVRYLELNNYDFNIALQFVQETEQKLIKIAKYKPSYYEKHLKKFDKYSCKDELIAFKGHINNELTKLTAYKQSLEEKYLEIKNLRDSNRELKNLKITVEDLVGHTTIADSKHCCLFHTTDDSQFELKLRIIHSVYKQNQKTKYN